MIHLGVRTEQRVSFDMPSTDKTTTIFSDFQLSPRFSVGLMNRSLALRITDVVERDLGLYYCIASVNTHLVVGRGTMLQGKMIYFVLMLTLLQQNLK